MWKKGDVGQGWQSGIPVLCVQEHPWKYIYLNNETAEGRYSPLKDPVGKPFTCSDDFMKPLTRELRPDEKEVVVRWRLKEALNG